jgi:glycerophosphoryl diester phosphodiesterase
MRATCRTVNDPATAHRLLRASTDGIITDAVDQFASREVFDGTPI